MAGIRTAIGTLRATTAGGGTVGVVTTCACACDVVARAEDTGRCGTGPARGWRCSWSPATTHPTPARRSRALSTSNDLAICVLPQWRARLILRPRDYERWLWRDETTDARRRRMARNIVSPAAASAMLPTYTRSGFVERGAAESSLRGSRRNDRGKGAGRTASSARCTGRTAGSNSSPATAGESTCRGCPACRAGATRTGWGCGRRRRGGRSRNEHIGDRGHARHGTATTVRGAIALVDGHRERRISTGHGATCGRLSGVGAPAVRRAVALRDSCICGAAKGGARLRARGGRSDALIHRGT